MHGTRWSCESERKENSVRRTLLLLIRMHIAVSRATSLLRIVGLEKEMRKDKRLAELIWGFNPQPPSPNGFPRDSTGQVSGPGISQTRLPLQGTSGQVTQITRIKKPTSFLGASNCSSGVSVANRDSAQSAERLRSRVLKTGFARYHARTAGQEPKSQLYSGSLKV